MQFLIKVNIVLTCNDEDNKDKLHFFFSVELLKKNYSPYRSLTQLSISLFYHTWPENIFNK